MNYTTVTMNFTRFVKMQFQIFLFLATTTTFAFPLPILEDKWIISAPPNIVRSNTGIQDDAINFSEALVPCLARNGDPSFLSTVLGNSIPVVEGLEGNSEEKLILRRQPIQLKVTSSVHAVNSYTRYNPSAEQR